MQFSWISKKIAQFSAAKPFGPEKCPVYLRAPWIGSASQQLEHQVKSAVQSCYGAVSPRLISKKVSQRSWISKKIAQFSAAKPFGPEKCPVYLRAPWIGSASQQLEHQVKSAVQSCYGAVSPRLIFSSQCMLPAAKKDVLPANQRSMVIYEYVCHCDSRYVGRTTQRLQERIKQHVPKAIRQKTSQPTRTQPNRKCKAKSKTQFEPECDSAIGQH